MTLQAAVLQSEVYMVCLQHALSTENEEVMGLLIGELKEDNVAQIKSVIMLRRSDKRKDRVEISPEQLTDASIKAEQMSEKYGERMTVLGWYHSHPHITVWPSHVDVQTQADYQLMEKRFVGLIFSVYSEDKGSKKQDVQVTCFQSTAHNTRREVDLHVIGSAHISEVCLPAMVKLPTILFDEECSTYQTIGSNPSLALLSKVHNTSELTKSLCLVEEIVSEPIRHALEARNNLNRLAIERILIEMAELYQEKLRLERND